MDNKIIYDLASSNSNMSDLDRLQNLYWALSAVIFSEVEGDVVELGCNAGISSVFFSKILRHYGSSKTLHLYDSFRGLPAPSYRDAYLKEGDCETSIESVLNSFEMWGESLPQIHPGWFNETLPGQLPDKISFAYLDGDFYESILISLNSIYPRLSRGAIVIVDDYCDLEKSPRAWDGLPGVKLACDEFVHDKVERFSVLCGTGDLSFAMLRKL